MEIHKYEKIWFGLSLALIIAFIATITYGALGAGIKMVDDSGGTVDPDNLKNTEFSDPGVKKSSDGTGYDVYVVARQFAFQPGTGQSIKIPADTEVTFYITSADVLHGFSVANTNINTMVIPGQVAEITTEFEETGEYGIICNEYCGSAHHLMEGKIEVVPKDEFSMGGDK